MKLSWLPLLSLLLVASCSTVGDFSFQDKVGNALYKVPIKEKEVELLGTVQVDMTTTNVLIFTWGQSTYASVLAYAKQKFNADDVVNLRVDVLNSVFALVYNSTTYRVTAQAVKYR